MANPSKARGTAWESAIRDYLNETLGYYWPNWRSRKRDGMTPWVNPMDPRNIKRQAQEGAKDVGDLHAWPFVLEAKDVKNPAVPTWLRQARVEAFNAGFPVYVVCHKMRGRPVSHGWVYLDVRTFTAIRQALGMSAREFWDWYGFGESKPLRGTDTSRWYWTTSMAHLAQIIGDVRELSR